jgi:hypothetical protein
MTITRANAESVLIRRIGAWLTFVGLDGTTITGANLDLNDPITFALLQSSYSVADITAVSNTDLSAVVSTDYSKIIDIAEFRALETVLQTFTESDVKGLSFSTNDDQFGKRVQDRIDKKVAALLALYGFGIVSAAPYAGGLSKADKQAREDNTDQVQPAFTKDLQKAPADKQITDNDWWFWR